MDNDGIGRRLEVAQTILLSAVILITAWCSYQASYWSGVASFKLAASHTMGIRAAESALIAEKRIMVDAIVIADVANAVIEKKQKTVDAYRGHLSPNVAGLLDAWLATRPLMNRESPTHPLAMREYADNIVRSYDADADALRKLEETRANEAYEAKSISDAYTFKTVVLAGVLFIGGIFPNFKSLRIRIALLCLDYVIAVVSLWQVVQLLIQKP